MDDKRLAVLKAILPLTKATIYHLNQLIHQKEQRR